MVDSKEEQALKARELAEKCFLAGNARGARQRMQSAVELAPDLPGTPQIVAAYDVHAAAGKTKVPDWYAVLGLPPGGPRTHDEIKKQYRRLCLLVHPDKNPSAAADGAFKLVCAAWHALQAKHPPLVPAAPAPPPNQPAPQRPPPPPKPKPAQQSPPPPPPPKPRARNRKQAPPPPKPKPAPQRPPPPPKPAPERHTPPPPPKPKPKPRKQAPPPPKPGPPPKPESYWQQSSTAKPTQKKGTPPPPTGGKCPACGAQSFNDRAARHNQWCMSCHQWRRKE